MKGGGATGCHSPGVLLAGAAPAVQRDDFVSADSRFADGTLLPAGPRLQPLGREGGGGSVRTPSTGRVQYCPSISLYMWATGPIRRLLRIESKLKF